MTALKFTPLLLALSLFAGGLNADQPAGTIATDTAWETPYYVKNSGADGPTVLVVGAIHGDQPAGYRAAEQIRRWPLAEGKMIVIPAANLRGLNDKWRIIPGVSDEERDLNRNFPITESGEVEPIGELARSIWELVEKEKPDWVIDFHEGTNFHISHQPTEGRRRSAGSTIIRPRDEEIAPIAENALTAVNATITNPRQKFVILTSGSVQGGLARTASEILGAKYIVPLTTVADQSLSLRVRQLRIVTNSILNDIGVLDRDCSELSTDGTEQE